MELTITTPALFFPAISLLLLAYTNRFLAIASLVRSLNSQYKNNPDDNIINQILKLRKRLILIRNMQILGSLSFLFCVLCMFLIYAKQDLAANYIFAFSMILLMFSLAISILEVQISVKALDVELADLRSLKKK
jgi:hypothetical protein